jgi:hypothetical protein
MLLFICTDQDLAFFLTKNVNRYFVKNQNRHQDFLNLCRLIFESEENTIFQYFPLFERLPSVPFKPIQAFVPSLSNV